jgi:uncharacterized repeat protein (TIGR02543 family)
MGEYTTSSNYFSNEGYYPDWRTYRSNGYSLRCVADESATVVPVPVITISGSITATKEYDGTPDFSSEHIDISNASLNGVIGDDDVRLDKSRVRGTSQFQRVGSGPLTLTPAPSGYFTLAGADAKYYRLQQPSVIATITPKPVTISLSVTKEYDGTPYFRSWDIDVDDFDNAIINGVLAEDFWSVGIDKTGVTGMLHSAEPGTSGTLAISGNFALEGGSARNYYLTEQPSVTAKITKRGVYISDNITATKEYDGTQHFSSEHIDISKARIIGTLSDNDDVTIDKSGVTGTLTGINGTLTLTGNFTLSGADTAKYFLSKQPTVLAEIIWEYFTVSFSADDIKYSPQIVYYDCKVFKPTDPISPMRLNYNFAGWFTDNGTFENEWDFGTYVITQDTTLYAKWNIKTYTVSFEDYTVSAYGNMDIPPQTIEHGNLAMKPADPERAGYVFGGWFTDLFTFENEWNFETGVRYNITLYVKWIVATGISEIESANVKIYPNPAKDELRIETGELLIKRVEIVDITGKIIINCQLPVINSINVSALSQGVYFIRVETDKEIVTEKFVKE